ncbi:Retrotransposon gag protein [Corchorus capsularis]|uniref:Retrotransposon gag protein n=1 Tax=Corchorus capsularis TaxID=210143 RepID=A0A1R3IHG7_COCAP|nr:Retrotransposon gag protein [Corchorus capsularis]
MDSFQTTFFQQFQQQAQQQQQQAQGQADFIRVLTEAVLRMGIAPGGQGQAPERQVDPPLPPLEEAVDIIEDVAQVDARNVNVYVPPPARVGNGNGHNGNDNRNGNQRQAPRAQVRPQDRAAYEEFRQEVPQLDRNQIIDIVQEIFGPGLRRTGRPAFHTPYPEEYDRQYPFPRGYKVPDFSPHFSGISSEQSTIEHVGRFTMQCGEANTGYQKLRLFPNSLTGLAFTWYINLPPNSIRTWEDMEKAFHTQFYRIEPEVSLLDLSRLSQKKGESAEDYLARFKKLRNRCCIALPEKEFVRLAQNDLDIELRKKFEGVEFRDYFDMSTKVARYENLLREDAEQRSSSYGTYYQEPNYELGVAEVKADRPIKCPSLLKAGIGHRQTQEHLSATYHRQAEKKPHDGSRMYSFDVSKTSDVFYFLFKAGMIKLPPGHKLPHADELRGKEYCKYHDSWRQSTNNCTVFRNIVQEKIERGILKFPEAPPKKEMGVDKDPFPAAVSMVSVNFPTDGRLTREQKAKGIARDDEAMPQPKERSPSIPVRYGYINRTAPSRQQVPQPMAPRPVALGSMPIRKLDLTTIEDMPMKVPNRSFAWRTVQRKLDFAVEDVKPSMIITSAVQGTSKPMLTKSKIIASTPHVLKPTVQFPTRSRSEIRPWLERRKKEIRTMAIQNEIKIRRDHAMEFNRPKMVRPTVRALVGVWQRVEHHKFPTPPIQRNRKTWRRRELRRRVKARKELQDAAAMEEEVTALATSLEKCHFEKDADEEAILKGMFKVTADMTFEYLVGRGEESENDTLQADDKSSVNSITFGQFTVDLHYNILNLPCVFAAKKRVEPSKPLPVGNIEEVIQVLNKDDDEDSGGKVDQPKDIVSDQRAIFHIKPLYIKAHLDGVPVNRVLVNNGAAVNILSYSTLRRLGKGADNLIKSDVTVSDFSGTGNQIRGILQTDLTVGSKTSISTFCVVDSPSTYNVLLGRDWIHSNWCVPSSLHQLLIFWNGDDMEIVHADNRPFKVEFNAVDARYYDETFGLIRFLGQAKYRCTRPMVSNFKDSQNGLKKAMENLVRPSKIIPYKPLGSSPIIKEISS